MKHPTEFFSSAALPRTTPRGPRLKHPTESFSSAALPEQLRGDPE
jgi:hypothetical protein